jgi:putative solute:sodium symporter small subunit
LVTVWAVAIFGFHFVLRIIEKPTPEPAYTEFEKVWDKVNSGNASLEEEKVFVSSALSVLGKLAVNDNDKAVLNNAVSASFSKLVPDSLLSELKERVNTFTTAQTDTSLTLASEAYQNAKIDVVEWAAPYAGLEKYSLKAKLLPFTLKADKLTSLTEEDKTKVPATMAKYLIHNQSFLTDFKFLGFPFHYFYTAVFLLILFVGLCWIYCYRTDKKMTKFEVVESA